MTWAQLLDQLKVCSVDEVQYTVNVVCEVRICLPAVVCGRCHGFLGPANNRTSHHTFYPEVLLVRRKGVVEMALVGAPFVELEDLQRVGG